MYDLTITECVDVLRKFFVSIRPKVKHTGNFTCTTGFVVTNVHIYMIKIFQKTANYVLSAVAYMIDSFSYCHTFPRYRRMCNLTDIRS
jgi:hypothetical protein